MSAMVNKNPAADLDQQDVIDRINALAVERTALYRKATALGTTVADLLGREVEVVTIEISPSLREFAREASLPEADVSMLAGIRYRGEQPRNSADWRYLYESIRRTIRGGAEPDEA